MRRPIPVILSAILLGILSLFQLLAAAGMIFAGVAMLHKSLPGTAAFPAPLPPHFLPAMFFGMAIFYVATAIWFILTLIGLCRLRSWSRISLLVIAGLTTAFAGMGTVISIAVPLLLPKSPGIGAVPNPSIMHGILLFIGAIYLIFTAIGIAQLIYFNQAPARNLFQQGEPFPLAPPNTSSGRYRPTAITILSWFFMIGSPFCLFYALFPLPAILFGFTFYGIAAHFTYVAFALIAFSLGYALYRLRPQAPAALVAWMAFGILNTTLLFTPWGQRNFSAYIQHLSPAPMPNPFLSTGFLAICCVIGLAFNAFLLWLLHRHREAFTPAPPAPPLAPTSLFEAPLPG